MKQIPLRGKRRGKRRLRTNLLLPITGTEADLIARVVQGVLPEIRAPQRWLRMGITPRTSTTNLDLVADLPHTAPKGADPQALDGAGLEVVPNAILHLPGKALHQITQCTHEALRLLRRRTMRTTEG